MHVQATQTPWRGGGAPAGRCARGGMPCGTAVGGRGQVHTIQGIRLPFHRPRRRARGISGLPITLQFRGEASAYWAAGSSCAGACLKQLWGRLVTSEASSLPDTSAAEAVTLRCVQQSRVGRGTG